MGLSHNFVVEHLFNLRKHCFEITLLVETLTIGNEGLNCFRGRRDDAVRGLRERFRLELNDRVCLDYVNGLVDDSLENALVWSISTIQCWSAMIN